MFYADPCVSNDKVLKLINTLKELGTELHQFTLCKDDRIIVEMSPEPYRASHKRLVYSVSKSFTSTAVGLCYDKGLIDPKKKLIDYFPEDITRDSDERIKRLTVHDLLVMHTRFKDFMRDLHHSDDPVRAFFSHEVEDETDEYHYCNAASFMLSALVTQVTGLSVIDLLNRDFFPYIGVNGCTWENIAGISEGYSGLHISARDIALSMQVYLNKGTFRGRRILSKEWVELATSNHISTANDNKFVWWTQGYGYQFWMNKGGDGCRAVGSCGQNGYIFPSLNVTAGEEGIIKKIDETDDAYRAFCADFEGESTITSQEVEAALDNWYPTLEFGTSVFEGTGKTYDFSDCGSRFEKMTVKDRGSFFEFVFSDSDYSRSYCFGKGFWKENITETVNFNSGLIVNTIPSKEKIHFSACCNIENADCLKAELRFFDCPLRHTLTFKIEGKSVKLMFNSHDVTVVKEYTGTEV